MYKLFLDDRRNPENCRNYPGDESVYDQKDWYIARSFNEFYYLLKEFGLPEFVSFDYDLGQGDNGLKCAEFLKFYCEDLGIPIPEYRVHSAWPGIKSEFDKILKT